MKVYESDAATVYYGLFRGWRVIFKPSGPTVKVQKFVAQKIASISQGLQARGFHLIKDDVTTEVVMEWLIEFCASPTGGLGQQVMMQESVEDIVQWMVEDIKAG